MLAQNFKTATDLGITEVDYAALIQVLGMMERGELVDDVRTFDDEEDPTSQWFDMATVLKEDRDCGTSGCICGWAYVISGRSAFSKFIDAYQSYGQTCRIIRAMPPDLVELFGFDLHPDELVNRTQAKSAIALRSYLTTGQANWAEALACAE